MIVTDEMVDVAYAAYHDPILGLFASPIGIRAALEAIAPLLIAPYQRELDACNGALANSGAAYALALADRNKWIAQGREDALNIARRTLIWSADQEAKFVDALRDAGMT